MQQLRWLRRGSTLYLSGELSQKVLNQLWNSRFEVMKDVILIDLSDIIRVDTAGIALLAHLVDTGKKYGTKVFLTGVSENVLTLARLYNLSNGMLPLLLTKRQ